MTLQEEVVIKACRRNPGPADHLLPVHTCSAVGVRRFREVLVHFLAELLGGQILKDQVGVYSPQCEDKYTELLHKETTSI